MSAQKALQGSETSGPNNTYLISCDLPERTHSLQLNFDHHEHTCPPETSRTTCLIIEPSVGCGRALHLPHPNLPSAPLGSHSGHTQHFQETSPSRGAFQAAWLPGRFWALWLPPLAPFQGKPIRVGSSHNPTATTGSAQNGSRRWEIWIGFLLPTVLHSMHVFGADFYFVKPPNKLRLSRETTPGSTFIVTSSTIDIFFEITNFSKILSKFTFFSNILSKFDNIFEIFQKECKFRKFFRKKCRFRKSCQW